MPVLDAIWIYPIKSLDGVSLSQARLLPNGALRGDREFSIVDESGRYVNGKRTARIHQLRANFNLKEPHRRRVSLWEEGISEMSKFGLDSDLDPLEEWLSQFFKKPVRLQQNPKAGFPDDTNYPGPTAIATATLDEVASWFEGVDTQQMRQRLRANLEIGEAPAFWEDRLCANGDRGVPFQVGEEVTLAGTNSCARCIVPTRHPQSGESLKRFQAIFAERRQATLPSWSNPAQFNHYYRLTTNTRLVSLDSANSSIRVGDRVQLVTDP